MSTTTANLGLFKYDTTTDGALPFNIDTALNNNWDIIDTAVGTGGSPETVVDGTTWYRRWSDGWKEQGGNIIITNIETVYTEQSWTQPTLSNNGTLGGSSFAVSASSTNGSNYAWKAFDKSTSTHWQGTGNAETTHGILTIYNPEPLKITNLRIYPKQGNGYYCEGYVSASNTNSSYTTISSSFTANSPYSDISLNNSNFYNYYQITITKNSADTNYPYITDIYITATTLGESSNANISDVEIVFPSAFQDTNYVYTIFCNDNITNVLNKTISGMTLISTTGYSVSWTACGY